MPDNPPQQGQDVEIPNPAPGTRDHEPDPPPDRVTGQPPKGR